MQVVEASVGDVGTRLGLIAIFKLRGAVPSRALLNRILAQRAEQVGQELVVVVHPMEVEIELEEHTGGVPNVAQDPCLAFCQSVEIVGRQEAASRLDTLFEDVDVGEQVVGALRGAADVDAALVVVSDFMAWPPDIAWLAHLLVVHDSGDGALGVPCAVGGGVHVGTGAAEGIPYIAVAAFEVLNAHVAFLILHYLIPDSHQTFHLVRLCCQQQVAVHLED